MSSSNVDIERELDQGNITITQVQRAKLQPASCDLRIGNVRGNVEITVKLIDGKEKAVFVLKRGETAAILTLERIYLSENIAGHVDLTNLLASQGIHLLNPGHIDPGWGQQDKSGRELTAIVRNVSDQPIDLVQEEPFLTLTLSYLKTTTTRPYWQIHPEIEPLHVREARLAMQAQRIASFMEPQRKLETRIDRMETELESKVSWKTLINGLALLITGFGIVISVTIGIVTTASSQRIEIGTYALPVPVFLLAVLPSALIVLWLILRAVLSVDSRVFKRRKSNT